MTVGDRAADADAKRTTAHKIRNLLHGAKLQLALLEVELQGDAVTGVARQAVSRASAQIDQLAQLLADPPSGNADEGAP